MKASYFHIIEQKRRCNHGAGNAALGRAKSSESRASQIIRRILHVGVNGGVVADPQDIAEGSQGKALDHASAHRLLMSVCHVDAGYGERHTLAARNPAGDCAYKIGKVLLMDRRDYRIGHSFHFETPFVTIFSTGIDKFLP